MASFWLFEFHAAGGYSHKRSLIQPLYNSLHFYLLNYYDILLPNTLEIFTFPLLKFGVESNSSIMHWLEDGLSHSLSVCRLYWLKFWGGVFSVRWQCSFNQKKQKTQLRICKVSVTAGSQGSDNAINLILSICSIPRWFHFQVGSCQVGGSCPTVPGTHLPSFKISWQSLFLDSSMKTSNAKSHWPGLGYVPISKLKMESRELKYMDCLDLVYMARSDIGFCTMIFVPWIES